MEACALINAVLYSELSNNYSLSCVLLCAYAAEYGSASYAHKVFMELFGIIILIKLKTSEFIRSEHFSIIHCAMYLQEQPFLVLRQCSL